MSIFQELKVAANSKHDRERGKLFAKKSYLLSDADKHLVHVCECAEQLEAVLDFGSDAKAARAALRLAVKLAHKYREGKR